MTTTNARTAQCVCAERGYCADVPDDPKACPVCRLFDTDDRCPALWVERATSRSDGGHLAQLIRDAIERARQRGYDGG